MAMYEQAEKINQRLKSMFKGIEIRAKEDISEEAIADLFIRFGQIAKFRCRSNVAYKNFLDGCFKDLFEIVGREEPRPDGSTFTQFKAIKKEPEMEEPPEPKYRQRSI